MGRRELKAGALTAPLPAVLVTVSDGERANIITVGWTGILSTHPARTYVSVRPERYSYKMLKQTKEFVVNLTTAEMAKKVDFAGIYSGRDRDKIAECGFTALPSNKVSPPTLKECPFALECRVVEVIPMGTHDVFIADIVSVSADESVIDSDGRLRFDRAGLMAYAHGEYFALGESLGKFGFSASREGRKKPLSEKRATTEKKPTEKKAAFEKRQASTGSVRASAEKREKRSHTTAEASDAAKESAVGRPSVGQASREKGGRRPFYLDAPRKGAKASGRSRRGGKK